MSLTGPLTKVTVRLATKSGILQDRPQNDFHFATPETPVAGDYTNLADDIKAFYDGFNTKLSKSLSLASDAMEISFYNVPTNPGPLGPPTAVETRALSAVGSSELPEECAMVLSWHAAYTGAAEFGPGRATRPRARRRNRIYIGPLSSSVQDADATTFRTIISAATQGLVVGSAEDNLWTAAQADGWALTAWSQTLWNWFDMVDGLFFMDNAFDTIRGRGPASTNRLNGSPLA